jgi:hypothetical protein
MKRIALYAAAGVAILAGSAKATVPESIGTPASAQECSAAPSVASVYLRAQAGRKLTMTRAAIVAEVTKLTGTDGEFAGLKPCDSGYPNAVRFYIDEIIKAGTDNSTPSM